MQLFLVNDSPADRRLLHEALLDLGESNVRITGACLGATAMRLLLQAASDGLPPSLILAWQRLPDGDGASLVHRIKGDPRLAPIPTVLCGDRRQPRHAAAIPADLTIELPLRWPDYLAVIQGLIAAYRPAR